MDITYFNMCFSIFFSTWTLLLHLYGQWKICLSEYDISCALAATWIQYVVHKFVCFSNELQMCRPCELLSAMCVCVIGCCNRSRLFVCFWFVVGLRNCYQHFDTVGWDRDHLSCKEYRFSSLPKDFFGEFIYRVTTVQIVRNSAEFSSPLLAVSSIRCAAILPLSKS